jgi:ankyrin repeat protein/DNA-directed RNA polymerase subunit RPC12/RpoP
MQAFGNQNEGETLVKFNCSQCGQHIEADDEMAGLSVSCPSCAKPVVVPVVLGSVNPSPPQLPTSAPPPLPLVPLDPKTRKANETKTGSWRPGDKVPKTGTYKCLMCGPGGAVMHALNLATGLAGIKPAGLAASLPTSTRCFREGEQFTKCPNCAALAADAGTTSDMTGWDLVSVEEATREKPTSAEVPKPSPTTDRATVNKGIAGILARFVTPSQERLNERLIRAVQSNRAGAVKSLLRKGADPNAQTKGGDRVLMQAGDVTSACRSSEAAEERIEILAALIRAGAEINARNDCGQTVLWRIVNQLEQRTYTAMSLAESAKLSPAEIIGWSKRDRARIILAANAVPQDDFDKRVTAILEFILQQGADPRVTDNEGSSVLTVESIHLKDIHVILAAGADPNNRDGSGYTPLMQFAILNAVPQAQAVLKAGADPNASDNEGNTLLMFAALGGGLEITRLLLDAGADPNVKNESGNTALSTALANDHPSVAKLLRKVSS